MPVGNACMKRRWEHAKFLLWYELKRSKCHFCSKALISDKWSFDHVTDITQHHLDGNHFNDDPANVVFAHSTCHRMFHMSEMRAEFERCKQAGKQLCTWTGKKSECGKIEEQDGKRFCTFRGYCECKGESKCGS